MDRSQRIITATFTGDLELHRAALTALYDGPLCVELTKKSRRELADINDRVVAEVKGNGMGYLGGATENAWGTVELTVMAATEEQMRALSERYDGVVEVESFRRPVP